MDNDNIYTIDKLSELLGVDNNTLSRKAQKGEIPSYKVGNKRYFLHSEIIDYIKSHASNSQDNNENENSNVE